MMSVQRRPVLIASLSGLAALACERAGLAPPAQGAPGRARAAVGPKAASGRAVAPECGPAPAPRTFHIAGDSTAAVFPAEDPRVGWGAALEARLASVKVNDAARSGRSSKSFWEEGHWQALKAQLGRGDLVLIQFGHNDEKSDPKRGTDAATTFRDFLRGYVSESRALGAEPVLLTPICRRRFEGASIVQSHGDFPAATRALAEELKTPLLDMTDKTRLLLERLGPAGSQPLFAPDDNTHLSRHGAELVAELVAEGLRELGIGAPASLSLWPEGLPGPRSAPRPGTPAEHEKDGRLFAVQHPALTFHPAPAALANGAAVVVCPGGGYARLCMIKEGSEVAAWLNGLGIAAFVLRYRLGDFGHPAPLQDVLRALRLVRSRAAELRVDPGRLGVLGFSAGGHLAGCAATLFDDAEGKTGAALDAVDARPNLAVLLYPVVTLRSPHGHAGSRQALLGESPDPQLVEKLSLETRVTARTPPMFLMHTRADASVPVENSLMLAAALARAGVPHELALYDEGPHGLGLRPDFAAGSAWPRACAAWLRARGFIP